MDEKIQHHCLVIQTMKIQDDMKSFSFIMKTKAIFALVKNETNVSEYIKNLLVKENLNSVHIIFICQHDL